MEGHDLDTSKSDQLPLLPVECDNGRSYGGNDSNGCTYEEAIAATGFGRFHQLLLVLCGWAMSSDAIEVICVSYMLPSASCDLGLSSTDKGTLNVIILVGMILGSLVWGSLADRVGRRTVLVWSLTVNGLGGLVSSIAQVYWFLLVFRFVSGFGVGGSVPVILSYFMEFQPKDKRGTTMCMLITFWMGGNIIAAGLAWMVIPQPIGIVTSGFSYNSWRIFIALCTIPSLTSAAAFLLVPESPKFLLQCGEEVAALSVIRRVHELNKPKENPTFQITSLRLAADVKEEAATSTEMGHSLTEAGLVTKSWNATLQVLQQTRDLFGKALFWNTVTMLAINFTFGFGYYGVWMWFPEMLSRVERYGGSPCDLGGIAINVTTTNLSCENPDDRIYSSGVIAALFSLPSSIVIICLVDKVGRKSLITFGMIGSGACALLVLLIHNRIENLLVFCLFSAFIAIPLNIIDIVGPELFPTSVRSTAIGMQISFCRLGGISSNIIFGALIELHCVVSMLMVAGMLTIGGLATLCLPNTTKIDVH